MSADRNLIAVIALLLLPVWAPLAAAPAYDSVAQIRLGKHLFETNCSPCHGVHQEIVGPMLASITQKRSRDWLTRFIRDSQAVIVSGDAYAVHLFASYNRQVMPAFPMLPDSAIHAILQYIAAESFTHVDETPVYTALNETSNESILHGHTLFRDQCASCHYIHYESRYAPALGSVSRRHPRPWLRAFIHDSQQVIRGGDVYGSDLFRTYHNRVMVPMEFLTQKDIDDILAYITFSSASPPAIAGVNGQKTNALRPGLPARQDWVQPYEPVDKPFFKVLFIILGGIVALLYALLLVKFFRYLWKS